MQPTEAYVLWRDDSGHLQRTEVPAAALTLGAADLCGLVVEGDGIGPIHAAIERGHKGCRLRRLSRVRSVRVNDADVDVRELASGDRLALGAVEIRFVAAPPVAPTMLRLTLARGSDEHAVDLPVAGSVTVLGRMEGDILVDDDSVSSRHLEIENFGPGLRWVRDLGSTNGSELNGAPLGEARALLADGDVITVGRVRITVSEGGSPPDSLTGVVQRTVIFGSDSARA